MEAIAAIASFVSIGQALAAAPKVIEVLRSLVEVRQEILQLVNEVELLNTFGILIRETIQHLPNDDSIPNFRIPQPALLRSVEADLASVVSQLEDLVRECERGKHKNGQIKVSRMKWLQQKKKIALLNIRARRSRDYLQLILSCNSLFASTSNGRMLVDIHSLVTTQAHTRNPSLLPSISPRNYLHEIGPQSANTSTYHTIEKATDAATSLIGVAAPNTETRQLNLASVLGDSRLQVTPSERTAQKYEPLVHIMATLRRACPKRCACQCHSPPPRPCLHLTMLPTLYGWFSHAYNSVSRLNTPTCDIPTCQRVHSPICFNLRFPLLFCSWAIEASLSSQSIVGVGASLYLRVARTFSVYDDIWTEIAEGKIERVRLAVAQKHISPIDGNSAHSILEYAIMFLQYEIVLMFLDESSSVLRSTDCGRRAATYARHQLRYWDRNDREIYVLQSVILLDEGNTDDHWPIHETIRNRGDLTAVLKQSTEDIDALDNFGRTPLYWAIFLRGVIATQTLIAYGANPNVRNLCTRTPLMHAVRSGRLACAKVLVSVGCDIHALDCRGYSALYYALQLGNGEMVSFLLSHGARLTTDCDTGNALHWLARYPSATTEENFEMLVRAGADLMATNNRDFTPFMEALARNNKVLLRLLIDAGCKLDEPSNGNTILNMVAFYADTGSIGIIKETEYLVDVRVLDQVGDTPLDTFEYRMGRDRSELPGRVMPPSDDDVEAFRGLLQDIRDRYLTAEIRTLETVIQYLKEQEGTLGREALQAIIQEKIHWNILSERRTFRAIDVQIKEGMTEAAIESLEEFIEVSRGRIGTDPFESDYCRSISLRDEGVVVESNI